MSNPIALIVVIFIVLSVVTRCDQQQAIRNHSQTAHADHPSEKPA